jgi:uncharacterized protein (DUF1684 family)
VSELDLLDWRRSVSELYTGIRSDPDAQSARRAWVAGRNELFTGHVESPLRDGDPLRTSGIAYWPYDPSLRYELAVSPPTTTVRRAVPTERGVVTHLRSIGSVRLPAPLDATLELWWLDQYAGGLFLPIRDGTAGRETYGGGRYLLDTAKGADLGSTTRDGETVLTIDLNFLYHPSCRYDALWPCPLAPVENTIESPIFAGERL